MHWINSLISLGKHFEIVAIDKMVAKQSYWNNAKNLNKHENVAQMNKKIFTQEKKRSFAPFYKSISRYSS